MVKKQPAIWYMILIFKRITNLLSHKMAVRLGGFLGGLVPFFTKRKVREASARCAARLNISKREADAIVYGVYKHFGRAIAEFARIPKDAKNINKYVKVHGEKYLKEAVKEGRGVVLATAHIGNWEYGGVWCAQNGYKVNALGTDQRDDRITKLIMDLRVAGGSIALGKANDLRAMMKALKAGEVIAVPVDQDARLNGVLSMFLGHPASTPVGIAKLAQKLDCAILPGYCVRREDGFTFDLYLYPKLKGRNGKPYGEDIQSSVDDCNDIISSWIRAHPHQWMWMYPRWESYEEGLFDEVRN